MDYAKIRNKNIVIVIISLSILFSSFTLWLIESPMKYLFFIFEIFVLVTIYLLLNQNNSILSVPTSHEITITKPSLLLRRLKTRRVLGLILDVSLVILSSILILVNTSHISMSSLVQLSLTFGTVSVLPGYAVLNISKAMRYLSTLEVAVLSFLLSIVISGFSTLGLLSISENARGLLILVIFIILGTVSAVRHFRDKDDSVYKRPTSLSKNIDVAAIGLSIIFYLIFYYGVYPNFALLPDSDVARHYRASIILSRSPDLYTDFSYVLYHGFEAALQVISGSQQPAADFQSLLVLFNFFLPISVYVLAKRFLGTIDGRIPAISTIFYSVLSNLSFVYFVQLKLLSTGRSDLQLLQADVAEKAYNASINFLQPFAWFVPLSASFIMFVMVLLLLRIRSMPRTLFVPLYSTLILGMYLIHVPEAVIFVVFIAIYSFVSHRSNNHNSLRLDDALLSSFIASVIATAFYAYMSFIWKSELTNTNYAFIPILGILSVISLISISMVWRAKGLPKIRFHIYKFTSQKRFYTWLSIALVILYLFGFVAWTFNQDFKTSSVTNTGIAPWFIYPLLLGMTGLLALLSVGYMGNILPNSSVTIILGSILILFLMGRVISYVNTNFILTGYWEKRFLTYIFLSACLLAPIPLIRFSDHIRTRARTARQQLSAAAFGITLISLITLAGFSSIILQYEYWFGISANSSTKLTDKESDAINYLKNLLQKDPKAFTITPTVDSSHALNFAAPGYQFPRPEFLVFSKHPELPLLSLAAHNLDHAYIYVDSRDRRMLSEDPNSWFSQHLLRMLPIVFSNGEVTIYKAIHVSFPLTHSDTTLIIPTDPGIAVGNPWPYAYDIVAQSGKNYTVLYDKDADALKSKTVILSFDPVEHSTFYDKFASLRSQYSNYWRILSGYWHRSVDGLHGGDSSNAVEQMNLSPVSSNNVTVSTSFRINSISNKINNYVSIVYAWHDPMNFKYAGIMKRHNDIFVSLASVSNGNRSFLPSWPGINTKMKWKPGEVFNLTLSLHNDKSAGQTEQLFLNGTRFYSSAPSDLTSGYIGLAYGRIRDVVFDYFDIQGRGNLNLRGPSDYVNYIKSGGNLIVLNANGQGLIANYLLNMSKSLPIETIKLPLATFSPGVGKENATKGYGVRQHESYAVVSQTPIGRGKLTYINFQPLLVDHFGNESSGAAILALLGQISEIMKLKPLESAPTNFNQIPASFREINGTGNLEIISPSIIFQNNMNNKYDFIRITREDHKTIILSNVTSFGIEKDGPIIVTSGDHNNHEYIALSNGEGLYTNLSLGRYYNHVDAINMPVNLSFVGNGAKLTISGAGTYTKGASTFNDIKSISIVSNKEPIHIYARQPTINIVDGNFTFKELRSSPLFAKTSIDGQDLKVLGNSFMTVFMSDSYTVVTRFLVYGHIQRVPPLSSYSELGSFFPALSTFKLYSLSQVVRALLLIPFVVAFTLILYSRPRKSEGRV